MDLIKKIKSAYEFTLNKLKNFQDSKSNTSGKIGDPKNNLKILVALGIGTIVIFITYAYFSEDELAYDGMKELNKEQKTYFQKTKIEQNASINDELEDYDLNKIANPLDVCPEIIEKLQRGTVLNSGEKSMVEDCLKSEHADALSSTQKKILKMLNDDTMSEKEKEWLRENFDNDKAKTIVDALESGDANRIKAAKMIMNTPGLTEDEIEQILKVAEGKITDQDIIDGLLSDDPLIRKKAMDVINAKPGDKEAAKNALLDSMKKNEGEIDLNSDISDLNFDQKSKAAKEIKDRMAKRQAEIDNLKNEIADQEEELRNRGILDKVARGEKLTDEEQKLFDKWTEDKLKLKKLEEEQEKDLKLLNKILEDINVSLQGLGMKPLEAKNSVVAESKTYIDSEGNEVTAEEIKRLRLEQERLHDLSDFEGSLSTPLLVKDLKDSKVKIDDLVKTMVADIEKIRLMPDLRIQCVLETDILQSSESEQSGRRIVLRVLDNVYDSETSDVLIPMGSKLIGKTGSFSNKTGYLQVAELNRMIVGNKEININFAVLTADGREGIPGKVLDTRDKKITVAMLSEFAAGTTAFFSEFIQNQLDNDTSFNPATQLSGAALSAGSKGFEKLAEIFVKDIESAESVYYTRRGLKLIISPN